MEKQRWEESERRREEERRSEKRKSQKKEDAGARKDRKVAIHCVFPMICGSGGSKSRLAKAAGAETSDQMRGEKLHAVVAQSTFPSQNAQNTSASEHFWKLRWRKCTPLWREAHVAIKSVKNWRSRTTFESWDVEKVHAVVARSTFSSQHAQSTPGSEHFLKMRCRTSARFCCAKHISKSKCYKHHMFPLLDVQMSFCVGGARDCAPCQKWAKREGFVAVSTTTTTTLHHTPLQLQLQLHYTTLHSLQPQPQLHLHLHTTPTPTPHNTTHYTALHYTTPLLTLHYTTYLTLHYTTPYSTSHYTHYTSTNTTATTLYQNYNSTTLQL